jgi:hypothetical protein
VFADLTHTVSGWLQDSQLMPILILIVAAFLLMTSMRRRRPAATTPSTAPAVKAKSDSNVSTHLLRRDLDDLMVELQDLSRRISAEIDTRFAKLEAAMKDADRRIAALNRLSRLTVESSATTQPTLPPRANGSPAPAAMTSQPLSPVDDVRHSVIYELADAGFSPIEIARDLGRTPGEVELILNLRRQQTKN